MMKAFKKIVCGVLCLCAATGALAGCGGGGDDDYEVNYDIDLTQKIDLKVMTPSDTRSNADINADPTVNVVKQVTGYNATYTKLDDSSDLLGLFSSKAQYHAIKLTTSQFADIIDYDVFLPLGDVLDAFGPDIKTAISDESWATVTYNGKIYGIPERASSDNVENPIVFRQDWLDLLRLDEPTNKEEFRAVLEAFKTANANGQIGGAPQSFTPFTYNENTPLVYAVSASFGIYSDWQEYEIGGVKKVLHYTEAPNYAQYIDYMAGLYEDGLIDSGVGISADVSAQKFYNGNAGSIAASIWSIPAFVEQLGGTASNEMDDKLCYVRTLNDDTGKFYRSGGYTYVTVIPYYMAENAGYTIDWINSKLTDKDSAHNFRTIVLGEEGTHYNYSSDTGYVPGSAFAEKNKSDYYLTGSNENVYTEYWKARVRKNAEMFRAWELLMEDADTYGVYNVVDFTPPLPAYALNRGFEETAGDHYFQMVVTDGGSTNLQSKLNLLQSKRNGATNAINEWKYGD